MPRIAISRIISICLFIFLLRVELSLISSPSNAEFDDYDNPSQTKKAIRQPVRLLVIRTHPSMREHRDHLRFVNDRRSNCSLTVRFVFGNLTEELQPSEYQTLLNESMEFEDFIIVDKWAHRKLRKPAIAAVAVAEWLSDHNGWLFEEVLQASFDISARVLQRGESIFNVSVAKLHLDPCLHFVKDTGSDIKFTAVYFPKQSRLSQSRRSKRPDMGFLRMSNTVGRAKLCDMPKSTFVLVAAHSAPRNFEFRNLIRSTWASQKLKEQHNFGLLFFLGLPNTKDPNHDVIQNQLAQEQEQYGDLVQYEFVDNYRNMTLKQLSILHYMTTLCPSVTYKYLLKIDEDLVIDVKSMSHTLKRDSQWGMLKNRSILCAHLNAPARVTRDKTKWYVSPHEYAGDVFPPYCSGAAYFITQDLVPLLLDQSKVIPHLWVDDTYISGTLAQAVGDVNLVQMPHQHINKEMGFMKRVNYKMGKSIFVHVNQNVEDFKVIWQKIQTAWGSH